MGISATGKVASASRDVSPLLFFGIGDQLDLAVLATLTGALLGSMAIALAVPMCLPLLAVCEETAKVMMRRFFGAFAALTVVALVLQGTVFEVLGVDDPGSGAQLLYRASVLAGLFQAVTYLLIVRLYARRASNLGLGMPFFAGVTVPIGLYLQTTLSALGVALLAGAILDLLAMYALTVATARGHIAEPAQVRIGPRARFEFLILSQALTLCVVFGERALVSRGGVGVVGAVVIVARVSAALTTVVAGSMEPQIVRRVASLGRRADASIRRLARLTLIAGALSVALCLGLAIVVVAADASVLVASGMLSLASLPAATCYRLGRATFYGRQAFGPDLALLCLGGVVTISVATAALVSGVAPVFALSIPLSSSIVAVGAGIYGLRRPDLTAPRAERDLVMT